MLLMMINFATIIILSVILSHDTMRLICPQDDVDTITEFKKVNPNNIENADPKVMSAAGTIYFEKSLLVVGMFSYIPIAIFSILLYFNYVIRNKKYDKNGANIKTVRLHALIPHLLILPLIGWALL